MILKYVSHLSSSEVGQEGGAKKGTISYKCLKCSYSVLDKVRKLFICFTYCHFFLLCMCIKNVVIVVIFVVCFPPFFYNCMLVFILLIAR